ncbi:hypothetical protein [Actinomadura sp. DC4]|uniref:hypothetical protein n=1 Tax=Actinomadura sp. DC4 TaxID=3055069 RepID=UPI0025B0069D|nr:hypothetical protein [Actinomadura sp. DC4]MDN3359676.1 hypothetical protein [Actinomadura sp. DC4]
MADDGSGGLSVPNHGNWNEWTFEQALKALTSEGVDLHTPAKANFFNWNGSPGASDWWSYHAWDKYYFGVNLNTDAINAWVTAVDAIDEMMPDVAWGKRGSMDSWTLTQLSYAINDLTNWAQTTGGGFDQWAGRLNSDDSSFKGKAAFLIYWRLKVEGDGLKDTYEQLASRHGGPIATSVADAAQQLQVFNTTMSRSWQIANGYKMRTWISDQIAQMSSKLNIYLNAAGLYDNGTDWYKLDDKVKHGGRANAESYIRDILRDSPYGDLTQESTWTGMSNRITQNALNNLKGFLDGPAQTAIAALAPKYVMATSSLMELTAPPPETAPKPDTDSGDGGGDNKDDPPPPPDGGGGGDDKINLPPPPDGGGGDGNLPPPPDGGGGDGNLPPPSDGGGGGGGGADNLDLPPANGGGADGLNLPGADGLNPPDGGGGPNALDLANGGGPDGLNSPDGGGDPANGGGGGGFLPGLVPPGGGGANGDGGIDDPNGTGPGSDGAFDENGLDNLLGPPADGGGGNSLLPPGSGDSNTLIPPGANGGGPDGNVNLGKPPTGVAGADGGLGLGPGGFGSDPGKGFGSGANLLGNGGAGNPFGGPGGSGGLDGDNGLGGASNLLNSGSPGADGAPGSPTDGSGGVPFFPPMMGGGGGAGGAGEKPQERERQTWLTEDEEIWGTRVDVRSGAIGRLDEGEDEIEEFPLAGPARRQRRADIPRRPRPNDERTTPAGEEATGSA